MKHFLGVEFSRSANGYYLSQRKYVLDLLEDSGMTGCKLASVPLLVGIQYTVARGNLFDNADQYRRLLGRLLYLNFTRPDISYVVNHLSQFVHKPCDVHMDGAMQVLAYLKGTLHYGLYYKAKTGHFMQCYVDADYGNCPYT